MPLKKGKMHSAALRRVYDELPKPRKMIVRKIATQWADGMLSWMEFLERAADLETLTLRMDEFVQKDPAKRTAVIKSILQFAGIPDSPAVVDKALAVFNRHSQAGTQMAKSSAQTGKKFLEESDKEELAAMCTAVRQLGKTSFIIPGSLGAAVQ